MIAEEQPRVFRENGYITPSDEAFRYPCLRTPQNERLRCLIPKWAQIFETGKVTFSARAA